MDFKYVKNYKSFGTAYGKSTDITPFERTAGRRVRIADSVKEHAGKEGVIIGISGKNVEKMKVKLDCGKSIVVDKCDLVN